MSKSPLAFLLLFLACSAAIAQPPSVIPPPKVELPEAQAPYFRVRYAPSEEAGHWSMVSVIRFGCRRALINSAA